MSPRNPGAAPVSPSAPGPAASPVGRTFAETLEQALSRVAHGSGTTLAAGGTLAGLLGLGAGCEPAAPVETPVADTATTQQAVIAYGQKDWAQQLGTRDTSKVRYYDEYWRDFTDCSGRYGCMSITVFVKVLIKPEWGAPLALKKIGAVYREVGKNDPITVNGYYFATRGDGMEEWHIPIKSSRHEGAFTFTAWYEDGKGGRFYDDNNGELYALAWTDAWRDYSTLRQDYPETTAKHVAAGGMAAPGAFGTLAFVVEDLDFDKELKLLYSTDNWTTTETITLGTPADKNKLYWVKNLGADYEQWKVNLEVPGNFSAFQFKLVYRHGVTLGARPTEFTLGGTTGLVLPKM